MAPGGSHFLKFGSSFTVFQKLEIIVAKSGLTPPPFELRYAHSPVWIALSMSALTLAYVPGSTFILLLLMLPEWIDPAMNSI